MKERDRKIIIKIVDVTNKAVSFRCIYEGSDYHIDDMPALNFDLTNFGEIDNREEFLKRIGQAAVMVAAQQDAAEHLEQSPVSRLNLRELVDQEIEMTMQEAYSGNNHNPHLRLRNTKKPWYKRLLGR